MKIYDFDINKASGEVLDSSLIKNKVLLIVNTATKCGLAPQFKELEDLHQKYKDKGLMIIGFPSNQFLNQEPETNESMTESCKINFGVSFLLSEKINVNGKNTHPVFKYLKKELGGPFGGRIKWNFTKFLITAEGEPYKRFAPTEKPKSIEKDIVNLLNLN